MSERMVPYHCPYCAEEDLRPLEVPVGGLASTSTGHGQWLCGSCRRAFALKFIGLEVSTE